MSPADRGSSDTIKARCRGRRALLGFAALDVALAASSARAQLEPTVELGSRIPTKPTKIADSSASVIRKNFAHCVFSTQKAHALRILDYSDPSSIDYAGAGTSKTKLASYLGMENCLVKNASGLSSQIGIGFPASTLRAMLAEEAYLATYATVPTLRAGSKESVDRTFASQESELAAARSLGRLADCVVYNGLEGADALVRTIPSSGAELKAARALAPAFGQCLVEGQVVELKPVNMRAISAEGLWVRFAPAPTASVSR